MSASKRCIVLTSSTSMFADQKGQITMMAAILKGNRIVYTEIDCSLEENREARDKYFQVSGIRGNYPQVFLQDKTNPNDITFVGSFEQVQQLNELSDVPREILEQNNLKTLADVFAGTVLALAVHSVACCWCANG
ncbi:TPA: hypothetical protein N0F65_010958 [Lagenidium giganteum]|uniref:Glutaredoxin domain-containing protein n=1 Tax=Lagenidium giganteum TaxID=4803 RepID=A0AAV2Z544_9STRA|nr:TPA: hypothetical protein N0F65_010958 [Lagenidium giganteum]